MSDRTAAVIVTYNRKDLLKRNIECLLKQTRKDIFDILIFDNKSTDGTHEALQSYIDNNQIIYFNTGANLGGAGGFNYGIKKATQLGYKYLWIMDDDTLPRPEALAELLKADSKYNGKYGFLSSKVLWKDGTICTMNRQKISKWRRVKNFDKEQRIQYASFVSLFLRTSIVKEMGLPYKEFFIWADDWEYTRRISKQHPSYLVPKSVVDHWCNSNVGADIITASADRIARFKYMFRNDVVLYRLDGFEGRFYLWLRTVFYTVKILTKGGDNKNEKLRIMREALKEGKIFKPDIEYL